VGLDIRRPVLWVAAWATWMPARNPVVRESPVIEQDGLSWAGTHAPMRSQGAGGKQPGKADDRDLQCIRNFNKYL
jgi:hypothetical protein